MEYLAEILDKEVGVYTHYLDLAMKKKQALIENNVDILDAITDEEKSLSTKVLALEAARVEYLREQGYPSNINLNDLLPKLPKEYRDDVKSKSENLKEILTQCKKFSDSNMTLLKQSSNYINHMIKIFSSNLNGGQPATYGKGTQKFKTGKIADMQG